MIEVTTELHQRTEHPSNIDFNTDDPEAKRYQKVKVTLKDNITITTTSIKTNIMNQTIIKRLLLKYI